MKYLLIPSALLLAVPVSAQSLIRRIDGVDPGDRRGQALLGGVDFNADGHADLVIGAPFDDANGLVDNGSISLVSGATGQVLVTRAGLAPDDHFGFALAHAGDLNADGVTDIAVGAPHALGPGGRPGSVRVLSGATFQPLLTVFGELDGEEFGHALAGNFDENGDGVPDLIVGAPSSDYPLGPTGLQVIDGGYAGIVSGASGNLFGRIVFMSAGNRCGYAVADVGDANADGDSDFAIGVPGPSEVVYVGDDVLTASNFGLLLNGPQTQSGFGSAIAGGLDSNGNGRTEIVIGAPFQDAGGLADAGVVAVIDTGTLLPLALLEGSAANDQFGFSVATLADLNGDGKRELGVGAKGGSYVAIEDLARGERMSLLDVGVLGFSFGSAVCAAGDFDADGLADYAVGAPQMAPGANLLAGSVFVFSSAPWSVAYCTAGTTSNGCNAALSASGVPSLSATGGFTLTAIDVEGDKSGLIFYGLSGRTALPWGLSTSFLCVKSPTQRTSTLSSGGTAGTCTGTISLDLLDWLATHPGALGTGASVGTIVDAQCWFRDPPSPKTTQLSNALEFILVP